jgi:hypothetical protein
VLKALSALDKGALDASQGSARRRDTCLAAWTFGTGESMGDALASGG